MANQSFLTVPIRALVINGEAYPVMATEATINRAANHHDTVEMSVTMDGEMTDAGMARIPFDVTLPDNGTRDIEVKSLVGQTVSFVYGLSPGTEQFVGYIVSILPDSRFKSGLNFKVQMLGATMRMQVGGRRFDTNLTVTQAVAARVNARGLGFYGDDHPYVWPSIAQTSETDWSVATSLAKRSGYVLFTWGAVVRMHSPLAMFKQFPFTTLVQGGDVLETERKLLDFEPQERSNDTFDRQGMEMFFFDPVGNVVSAKQTLTGLNPKWMPFTSIAVADREQAEAVLQAVTDGPDRWDNQAAARIDGDPTLYPGVIVEVRSNNRPFSGRWLVTGVKHKMSSDSFQTGVSLTRRTQVPAATSSTFEHFWTSTGKGKPVTFLRDREWFSSWNVGSGFSSPFTPPTDDIYQVTL